jgi:hypothetical protein
MKPKIYDLIKTLEAIEADFSYRILPIGTEGNIVECYSEPEGYAVHLAIPNESLMGGFSYENVILFPYQFEVIRNYENSLENL